MKTIICHSFPAWDSPYVKSTLELITRMASTHRVIFLDYPYTLKDFLKSDYAPKKSLRGKNGGKRIIKTEFGTVEIYNSIPLIPVNWADSETAFDLLMKVNSRLVGKTIKRILKTVDPRTTQVINAFNPVYGFYTHRYWGNLPVTYYAYDELSATPWAGKWGKIYEKKFLSLANRVVVSSTGLRQKFESLHDQVFCVKNGVNLNYFQQDEHRLRQGSRKIGYLGAFDERIDQELVHKVAEAYPDYLVEILGPVKNQPDSMLPSNVVFSGAKPQHELSSHLSQWAVCLIPFLKTPFTQTIYPLKINEYLASGKPVVTTDFADLSDFEGIVRIASNADDFVQGIQREIRSDNRLKASRRREFAHQNSWEARTAEFLEALAS